MRRRDALLGLAAGLIPASGLRAAPAPVVLELFTSQGCASCPPADALLGILAREPGVIALAWHVDYWNRLGWRDPYASAAWTRRQRAYAERLHDEVYTPALVINGAVMVVGSDERAVRNAMRTAPSLPLAVTLQRGAGGSVTAASAVPPDARLLRVAYTPDSATEVRAGENGGRRLREYRIVRDATAMTRADEAAVFTDARVAPNAGGLSATGPNVAGLGATGPNAAEPNAAGPNAGGPNAAGLGVVVLVEDAAGRLIGAAELSAG